MLTVVSIVAVLVVGALAVVAFFDVAFQAPAIVPVRVARDWQPPLVRGRQLLDWAAETAQKLTLKKLSGSRTPALASELATAMQQGATFAIDQPAFEKCSDCTLGCPSYCYAMLAVTPPEAIEVADYLRQSRPDEVDRIRERATKNAAQAATLDHQHYAQADIRCPLLGDDDECVAYAVRPLRCRGWCSPSENQISDEELAHESRAHLIATGAEHGLSRGLKAAGLDGELYELNGALATVLAAPDADERWIHGEELFADCKRYE